MFSLGKQGSDILCTPHPQALKIVFENRKKINNILIIKFNHIFIGCFDTFALKLIF